MRLILLVLFILPLFSFSQESHRNRKLEIGINFCPEYNFLRMDSKEEEFPKSGIGYSTGISFKFGFKSYLRLISGIQYGLKNYGFSDWRYRYADDNVDQQYDYLKKEISYSELAIPILLQFGKKTQRFQFSSGIGVSYAFSNTSKQSRRFVNGVWEDYIGLKKRGIYNFMVYSGVSYNVRISNNNSLTLEPNVKVYLRQYIVHDANLINLGLQITWYFIN